jgi:hypothetical protein
MFVGVNNFFLKKTRRTERNILHLPSTFSVNRAHCEMIKDKGANSPELFCSAYFSDLSVAFLRKITEHSSASCTRKLEVKSEVILKCTFNVASE